MKRIPIKVTDHAALRCLQRVKGIDIDAVKIEMATLVDTAEAHPSCSGIICDGFRYAMDHGTVITVTKVKGRPIRAAGRAKGNRR